jgi:CBS domain-containing protein
MAVADRPKLEAHTAGEAMTTPAVTVEADATIPAAARLMLEAGVSRLPVLRVGILVGIVTRADLVRVFVRSDDDIAREITDEILGRTLWIKEDALELSVRDGEVSLSGELRHTVDSDLLRRLVAQVPGVVSVETDLQLV